MRNLHYFRQIFKIKITVFTVIPTEAPVPAFVPVPALPPFLLSQESTGVQARKHAGLSGGIWLNNYIQYRESSIQYRVLSIKNADTSEQKSKFPKIF
jgi:hypothetical protein